MSSTNRDLANLVASQVHMTFQSNTVGLLAVIAALESLVFASNWTVEIGDLPYEPACSSSVSVSVHSHVPLNYMLIN